MWFDRPCAAESRTLLPPRAWVPLGCFQKEHRAHVPDFCTLASPLLCTRLLLLALKSSHSVPQLFYQFLSTDSVLLLGGRNLERKFVAGKLGFFFVVVCLSGFAFSAGLSYILMGVGTWVRSQQGWRFRAQELHRKMSKGWAPCSDVESNHLPHLPRQRDAHARPWRHCSPHTGARPSPWLRRPLYCAQSKKAKKPRVT